MFSIIELVFIGIALAVDCLTVSLATGITHRVVNRKFALAMSLSFGLFQAIMPIIGWQATVFLGEFIHAIDHWIAFVLLSYIGWKMISSKDDDDTSNSSRKNSILLILSLSIATSIDALAIGVTFTCVGYKTVESILMPISIIGLISFIFALAGYTTGAIIGEKAKISIEKYGGVMLILIGLKILIEHLL